MEYLSIILGGLLIAYAIKSFFTKPAFLEKRFFINRDFYRGQNSAIPPEFENKSIQEAFSEYGSLYHQVYNISKEIISSKRLSERELEYLENLAKEMSQHNCDFRIYHMKDAILHGIYCAKHK
jgi:hypothetical protein